MHGGFGALNAVDRPDNHCGKENRERRIRRRSGHGPVEPDWDLSRTERPSGDGDVAEAARFEAHL